MVTPQGLRRRLEARIKKHQETVSVLQVRIRSLSDMAAALDNNPCLVNAIEEVFGKTADDDADKNG